MIVRRFYSVLCALCAAAAVVMLITGISMGLTTVITASIFFAALAVCTGGMRLLILLRDRTSGSVRKAFHAVYCIGTVLFALFIVSFVAVQTVLVSSAHTDAESAEADYLLVLGAGINGTNPSRALAARLRAALDFAEEHPDCTLVVCGGQAEDEICSEASVMQSWLIKHGLDEKRILTEDKSRTTIQNIENAKAILDETATGSYSTAVVSNGFHLFRARRLMAKAGLDPYAVRASSPPSLVPLFYIREYFSLVKLALSGGL